MRGEGIWVKPKIPLGATFLGDGRCQFLVWAPLVEKVEVHLLSPSDRFFLLPEKNRGYHRGVAEDVRPGTLYTYRLDGRKERPDPASRFQPQGVHKPSQVVDPQFPWADREWRGIPLQDYILYELHVGTFTPEGTFEAIPPRLDRLKDLGITAVEIMPVGQFPGNRNWGYDGVHPFAVQNSYGGPDGLKTLVNACHLKGLAVVLDVVYNHLGPEGNYFQDFGPYFTDRYRTPWGEAVNFDGPESDEVRRFFIENAIEWISEFHVDSLRLDALHAIFDSSARPFLQELASSVHGEGQRLNRKVYLFAESDRNDIRLLQRPELGGYGLDAQWNDGFHHALRTLLTGERAGYYQDFGNLAHLKKAFQEGFVYSGQYSLYRKRRHGSSSRDLPASKFVVFSQNHDQVGNRMQGERLSQLVSPERLRLAAAAVLLSPFIPLLFMGEEYGETAPFLYFISHTDPALIEAVRRGRKEEFSPFGWLGEPPDPQDEGTFLRSKLNHALYREEEHRLLGEFYRELIRLRKTLPSLGVLRKDRMEVIAWEREKILGIRRWEGAEETGMIFNFSEEEKSAHPPLEGGTWVKLLDSQDERWGGKGTSVPDRLASEGEIRVDLQPSTFLCFLRGEEP